MPLEITAAEEVAEEPPWMPSATQEQAVPAGLELLS